MANTDPRSRAPKAVSLIAAALALGVGASALAGDVLGKMDVRGKLTDPDDGDPATPLAPYWEQWNGFLETEDTDPTPDGVLAVVLLGEGRAEPAGCSYALRGGDLTPTTLVAKPGTTLRIENTDPMAHELHADGLEGFSPLQTAPGNARTVPLDATGHFVIRDRLYPHVVGHLHVVDGLVACAEIDSRGRFRFKDVPKGSYTLKIFRGEEELASQSIEVSGRSTKIEPITLATGAR